MRSKSFFPISAKCNCAGTLLGFSLLLVFAASAFLSTDVSAKKGKRARHKAKPLVTKREEKKPSQQESEQTLGQLSADLAVKVEKDKPFEIDVWLDPNDKKFQGSAQVFMEQTVVIKYEPRVFTLKAGERKTVKATIVKTYCGLVQIEATANGWEDLKTIVDTGFSAKLKSNITDAMDSGITKSFTISLVDNQGNPAPLDADVDLTLQGSQIKLKTPDDKNWHDHLRLEMRQGSSSTQALNIQSDSLIADKGLISAQLESKDKFVVNNSELWIDVKPRWFVPLLMAILGGLLHSVYKIVKQATDPQQPHSAWALFFRVVVSGLVIGVISGGLAYLLASWGVLGIKVDTTTLQGFVILGFLFSYVGVDMILQSLTAKKQVEGSPAAPLAASTKIAGGAGG
jgi:hypothetical protein